MTQEDKEFKFETYNYKYNAWLPCEILRKMDDNIVKIRCHVFKTKKKEDDTEEKTLVETFETCGFWKGIRSIK